MSRYFISSKYQYKSKGLDHHVLNARHRLSLVDILLPYIRADGLGKSQLLPEI